MEKIQDLAALLPASQDYTLMINVLSVLTFLQDELSAEDIELATNLLLQIIGTRFHGAPADGPEVLYNTNIAFFDSIFIRMTHFAEVNFMQRGNIYLTILVFLTHFRNR
jgi:hypothetical protein